MQKCKAFSIYTTMNLDKIFSMFSDATEATKTNYKRNIESFHNHPAFHLGMFYKLINREDDITLQIIVQNLDVDEETRENIKEMSTFLTFTQAFSYLSALNIHTPEHLEYLLTYTNPEFEKAALKAMEYFESTEEYEKCGFIKEVLDYTIFSLNKLPSK